MAICGDVVLDLRLAELSHLHHTRRRAGAVKETPRSPNGPRLVGIVASKQADTLGRPAAVASKQASQQRRASRLASKRSKQSTKKQTSFAYDWNRNFPN